MSKSNMANAIRVGPPPRQGGKKGVTSQGPSGNNRTTGRNTPTGGRNGSGHSSRKMGPINILLLVASGFLMLILAGIILSSIDEIHDAQKTYHPSNTDYHYTRALDQENYGTLLDLARDNIYLGAENNALRENCHALAHYYDAAILYYAYVEQGDTDNADFQAKQMADLASQIAPEYQEHIEKINALLQEKAAAQ